MCGLKDKADVDTFPGIVREELLPVHEDDRKGVEVCVCVRARMCVQGWTSICLNLQGVAKNHLKREFLKGKEFRSPWLEMES